MTEVSFRAEFNKYSACLSQAGFEPLPGTGRYYLVGFGIAGAYMANLAAFSCVANGSISANNPNYDVWAINDAKLLTNDQSGL